MWFGRDSGNVQHMGVDVHGVEADNFEDCVARSLSDDCVTIQIGGLTLFISGENVEAMRAGAAAFNRMVGELLELAAASEQARKDGDGN